MDILRTVVGNTTAGLLVERLREKREAIADPTFHPEEEAQLTVLQDIRDTLFAIIGQQDPAPRPQRSMVTLFAYPDGGAIVQYEGRTRMNVQCSVDMNLYVDGRLGQFSLPIKKGWNNVDLADGSRMYVPNASAVANVYVEYANYAHGNSV